MKEDRVYLLHIQDSLANIREYTSSGREFFFKDKKTQDAVVRNLEIIGEAVKHLSPSLTTAHPSIPWKQIAGMRDKLIHDYFGVDLNLIWDVVATGLPNLDQTISEILNSTESSASKPTRTPIGSFSPGLRHPQQSSSSIHLRNLFFLQLPWPGGMTEPCNRHRRKGRQCLSPATRQRTDSASWRAAGVGELRREPEGP